MKHERINRPATEALSQAGYQISSRRMLKTAVEFSRKVNTQPKDERWIEAIIAAFGDIGIAVRDVSLNIAQGSLPKLARQGSVLFGRAMDHPPSGEPVVTDRLTLVLDAATDAHAVICVRFDTMCSVSPSGQLPVLADALAQLWHDRVIASAPETLDILSIDNPFGLTRAETRVCYGLKEGKSPVEIAGDFAIGIATVRTHLSNIYAKTDLPSQTAVVRQLLMASQTQASRRHDR